MPIGNSPNCTERYDGPVNCFQPRVLLQSKQRDGKKVRCVYDPAKTPLQRLLASGIQPAQKQQELIEVIHALDPIRLSQQLEQLQRLSSTVPQATLLSVHPSLLPPSAPFPWKIVPMERFLPRGAPRTSISVPCAVSRAGAEKTRPGLAAHPQRSLRRRMGADHPPF
jgi:hypothetical protein